MRVLSGKDGSEERWVKRIPPSVRIAIGLVFVVLAGVAIVVDHTTDLGDRAPKWLAAPLVIAAGRT